MILFLVTFFNKQLSNRDIAHNVHLTHLLREKGFAVFNPALFFNQYARIFYDDFLEWALQIFSHLKDVVLVFSSQWERSELGLLFDRVAFREKIPRVPVDLFSLNIDCDPGDWVDEKDKLRMSLVMNTIKNAGNLIYEKELYKACPVPENITRILLYALKEQGVVKIHYGSKNLVMFHAGTERAYKSSRKSRSTAGT